MTFVRQMRMRSGMEICVGDAAGAPSSFELVNTHVASVRQDALCFCARCNLEHHQ